MYVENADLTKAEHELEKIPGALAIRLLGFLVYSDLSIRENLWLYSLLVC